MNTSIPRIPPPVFFVAAVVVMIVLDRLAPIGRWLHHPWKYFGIIIVVLGFSLSLGSGIFFRKLGTNPRPGSRAKLIVTKGPFKYSRNSMYLGLITMLFGVSILLGTFSPLFVIPILFLILHTQFILREEKLMEEWFGVGNSGMEVRHYEQEKSVSIQGFSALFLKEKHANPLIPGMRNLPNDASI